MKNLYKTIELLEKHCGDIDLVSFGLAPNPNGFCYEIHNTYNVIPKSDLIKIDSLLNSLTKKEEEELKKLYL